MKDARYPGREGYLQTVRGRGGGVRFAILPERILLGHVVRSPRFSMRTRSRI